MGYTTPTTRVPDEFMEAADLNTDYVDNIIYLHDLPKKLKPALVRWVLPGWWAYISYNIAITAGRIYYIPIFVSETTTYIRIGVWVGTISAGTADLRIFAWNDGVPGALLLDAGTVDTGILGAREQTISHQLAQGFYFLAFRCTGTPSLAGIDGTYGVKPPVAGFETSMGVPAGIIPFVDAVYANPAPAPTNVAAVTFACVRLREN